MSKETWQEYLKKLNELAAFRTLRESLESGDLRESLEQRKFEVSFVPEYPFPTVTFASPNPFSGDSIFRPFLINAISGKISDKLPTIIRVCFQQQFRHLGGKTDAYFHWATNPEIDESGNLEELFQELDNRNLIAGITLAWGENPLDPRGEIADAHISLDDFSFHLHRWQTPWKDINPVQTMNNTAAFAEKIDQTGIGQWCEWGHLYPTSSSPLFAKVATNLVNIVNQQKLSTAVLIGIDDVPEDTYDKQDGEIILPNQLESMTAERFVEISRAITEKFKGNRSHKW